jgi:hypothetical protein
VDTTTDEYRRQDLAKEQEKALGDMTVVKSWDDGDGTDKDNEWPYPTQYVKRVLTGVLADDIRRALGEPDDTIVYITEVEVSEGYSEYTTETDYQMEIECGKVVKEFDEYGYGQQSNLVKLIEWIEAEQKHRDYVDAGGASALYEGEL